VTCVPRWLHRTVSLGVILLAAGPLTGCSATAQPAGRPAVGVVVDPGAMPTPPGLEAGSNAGGGLSVVEPGEPAGGDLTRAYAEQLPAPPGAEPPLVLPGVDYSDPLAVARAYLTARWTYDTRDPAGYLAARTAPGLTTPAFAARSSPGPGLPAGGAVGGERSTVEVGTPTPLVEAPGSPTTAYVQVPFHATVTHPGAPAGQSLASTWQLRLTHQPATGGWRVDGVLATR
jgi:hypothetical protein